MSTLRTRLMAGSAACLFAAAAAATTTIDFNDAFDRPDSALIANGWQELEGDLVIQGHELRNAAGIAGWSVGIQPSLVGDRQSASAMFASTSNNSIAVLGLVLQHQNSQSYYALYRMTGGTSVLRIAAVTNGQEIVLAQTGVPNPSENSLFKLSAVAHDGTLSLTLEGGKTLTVTDSRYVSGTVGILLGTRTTNAALRASHRADVFAAEIVTGDPVTTPRLGAALAADPAPQSVAPGTLDLTFANVVLDAGGSAEDIAVRSVQLDLESDTGSTTPTSCQLFDGASPVLTGTSVVNPSGAGVYTFSLDSALVVPVQAPKTLRLECDVPANASVGDTVEWRLRATDAIDAVGAVSGDGAVIQVQESPDNQNQVTVRTAGGGTEIIDLTLLRGVLRGNEIRFGPDLGEQKPPLLPHAAVNFEGQSPPNTAWLTVYDQSTYGDGMVCADMLDSEINGEQCGGVAALVTEGASGRAIVARSCDAKGTDTLRLGVLNTSTGAVTPLVNTNLFSRIDTYGGTNPPANCDHHQNQADYHMYCQWVRTCLTVATNQNGTVTFAATSFLRGTGLKNDASRNDPDSPSLTPIGTATWTGTRPANVAMTGKVGLLGTATQGWERISLTNLVVDP